MGRKGSKGAGLRTSREVYDRLRWDPNLDHRVFVIGYEERFSGLAERSFEELSEDVPWHRVQRFRVGDLVVWDRARRIDRLFGSGHTEAEPERIREAIARVQAERAGGLDPTLERFEAHRFEPRRGEWVTDPEDRRRPDRRGRLEALTVVTLNVLFDLHEPAPLHTAQRVPVLLSRLRREKADVIALQEVTPQLLGSLLSAAWVREGYWVSDGPAAATVRPYGQLVLSRWPIYQVRLRRDDGGGPKRLLYVELGMPGGRSTLAVVHLTSDRAKRAAQRRTEQLDRLRRDLAGAGTEGQAGPALLVGDFNSDDAAVDQALMADGWTDVWPTLRPHDDGPTFDPEGNALARVTSRNPRPRRLDRIWVRGTTRLRPVDIVRIGLVPEVRLPGPARVPISDHYGLRARFARLETPSLEEPSDHATPVHRTAVVVIPPRDCWGPIEAIRREHDRASPRWMPHITLLYGFVPPEQLDDAASRLERRLRDFEPFEVTLAELGRFEHRRGATIWARPRTEPEGALQRLQATMQAAFPGCDEQSRHGSGFCSHLTLGQLPRGAVERTMKRWQSSWTPLSFFVDSVAVIVRRGDRPFEVHRVIPLRGPSARRDPDPPASPAIASLMASLRRAWSRCMPGDAPWPLFIVGSRRLGVAAPDADLDVVGLVPSGLALAELSERLPARLRAEGHAVVARPVLDATVPRLALTIDERDVDVQPLRWPGEPPDSVEQLADRAESQSFDPDSHQALLAVLDAEAILSHASAHGGLDRFTRALAAVRGWAARRDLDANWLGYPGGLAWAVMVAWAAALIPADPTDPRPGESLGRVCVEWLALRTVRDWSEAPVTITRSWWDALGEHRASMVVEAPAAPARNCMSRASSTTVAVLEAELERGLDAPAVEPFEAHAWFVRVTIGSTDERAGQVAQGVVMSRAAGLVRRLERELPGGRLRPYSRFWPRRAPTWSRSLLIGLDGDEITPTRSEAVLRDWERAVRDDDGWPEIATVELAVVPADVAVDGLDP